MKLSAEIHSAEDLGNIARIIEALQEGYYYPSPEAMLTQAVRLREVVGILHRMADKLDGEADKLEEYYHRPPPTDEDRRANVANCFGQLIS